MTFVSRQPSYRRRLARGVRFAAIGLLALMATPFVGQQPAARMGVVDDWSHHHLVFSNPGTLAEAVRSGSFDKWYRVVNDPRYQMQQRKRSLGQRAAAATPDLMPPTPISRVSRKLKQDWSTGMGGVAASLTGTVGTLGSSSISGSSTLTVDGVTFDASPPAAASRTGTFTGNPTNGQTATIGGSEVLTASLSTAAAGSITIGSSFCIGPAQGITINGTSLTTNATAGTGTFVVSTVPNAGETVVIGGVTYTFETALSGTTPANQVLVPGTNNSGNRTITAENLSVAINNAGTCGSTSGGVCSRNVTAANPQLSSTDNSSATQTLTSLCADNAQITGTSDGTKVTVNNVAAASSAGTNSSTTFALNSSGTRPASQTVTAANILTAVNTNTTTAALVTASSGGTGIVSLVSDTWGTVGNYTVTQNATSGVTVSGMSGGADGTNTGTSFAIDNVLADAATNLAAAITRNGGTVGVTATSNAGVVTVTATPGSSGNSVTLAETLSNFSWSGSPLTPQPSTSRTGEGARRPSGPGPGTWVKAPGTAGGGTARAFMFGAGRLIAPACSRALPGQTRSPGRHQPMARMCTWPGRQGRRCSRRSFDFGLRAWRAGPRLLPSCS